MGISIVHHKIRMHLENPPPRLPNRYIHTFPPFSRQRTLDSRLRMRYERPTNIKWWCSSANNSPTRMFCEFFGHLYIPLSRQFHVLQLRHFPTNVLHTRCDLERRLVLRELTPHCCILRSLCQSMPLTGPTIIYQFFHIISVVVKTELHINFSIQRPPCDPC